jgi:HK97 family phage prohead protease
MLLLRPIAKRREVMLNAREIHRAQNMASEPEIRAIRQPAETRSATARSIGGYGVLWNQRSQLLPGGFFEQVEPSFANKTIGDGANVLGRYDHRNEFLLGSTNSGTLRLTPDRSGLGYEIDLPACRSDVYEWVDRGDVSGSSFAFAPGAQDDWSYDNGAPVRHLVSGLILDIGPTPSPAYLSSTATALRSLAEFVRAPFEDVVEAAESRSLGMFFERTDNRGPAPVAQRDDAEPQGISTQQALLTLRARAMAAERPKTPHELALKLRLRRMEWDSQASSSA